eukprot:CAMPEP_0172173980 /NCGR_PEP_ID=MMETSP1050-20130122/13395_1 /TAXON_ID=233186 /ORGANISM="Cryptomonas curvata, Strain CCAP979/52" /LENGTH=182 /DNA_ID=CAMNT_0012845875 /DNA_START=407 /DNA_END=953 /DNA_ORIENTATION=+
MTDVSARAGYGVRHHETGPARSIQPGGLGQALAQLSRAAAQHRQHSGVAPSPRGQCGRGGPVSSEDSAAGGPTGHGTVLLTLEQSGPVSRWATSSGCWAGRAEQSMGGKARGLSRPSLGPAGGHSAAGHAADPARSVSAGSTGACGRMDGLARPAAGSATDTAWPHAALIGAEGESNVRAER